MSSPERRFGHLGVFVNGRVIVEVGAFAENGLRPFFSTVVGAVEPGVSVKTIEERHGEPIYVEYGMHGLRMKGWKIGDYLVFVESNSGMYLPPEVERVHVFHKDCLPSSDRMWSLKGRTTLQALMDGKPYIEKR